MSIDDSCFVVVLRSVAAVRCKLPRILRDLLRYTRMDQTKHFWLVFSATCASLHPQLTARFAWKGNCNHPSIQL